MDIGEKIKNRRLELGMTQDELAQKVGYKSRSSINKIELARSVPLSKLEKIAIALETTPGALMGWTLDINNPEEQAKEDAELLLTYHQLNKTQRSELKRYLYYLLSITNK